MNNEDVLNIISSSLFANICTLLSAVGTISAVIVSLYLSRKNEKIKYKIIRNFIIPIGFVGDFLGNYYSLSLINLSKYLSPLFSPKSSQSSTVDSGATICTRPSIKASLPISPSGKASIVS